MWDSVSYDTLPAGARGVIAEMLDDIRLNPRYTNQGYCYEVAGSVDEYGYVEKGGFWNDNSGRAAYGITKSDVKRCRQELKAIGLALSFDDVDSLLLQGLMASRGTLYPEMSSQTYAVARKDDPKEYFKLRAARRREEARAGGYCTMCLNQDQRCTVKSDGTLASTCYECGKKANDRRLARSVKTAARKAKPKAKKAKVR